MRWLRAIGVVLFAIFLIPIALAAGIWQIIRGGASTSPEEMAVMLRRIAADGADYDADWDTLDCVKLRTPQLEAIRIEACKVPLPLTPEGRLKLIELAKRAESVQPQTKQKSL